MSIPKQTVAELFLRLVATKAQRIGFGSAIFNHVVKVHISRDSTSPVDSSNGTEN